MTCLAVHPHAGGENGDDQLAVCQADGSPPRGWGKRPPVSRSILEVRFTPTRVGKTISMPSQFRHPAVHPHAGGENS